MDIIMCTPGQILISTLSHVTPLYLYVSTYNVYIGMTRTRDFLMKSFRKGFE